MGYCSNVIILMKENQFNAMVMELTGTEAEDYFEAIDMSCVFIAKDGTRYTRVDWNEMKWYDDTILHYLRKLDKNIYWEYLRIGEYYDDIECDGNVPHDERWRLYCRREIVASTDGWTKE